MFDNTSYSKKKNINFNTHEMEIYGPRPLAKKMIYERMARGA
jgi:hypothetical protein